MGRRLIRKGAYWRREDSRWIARFFCPDCRRSFSSSRLTPCFGQRKRRLNGTIAKLLCSGVSQRRIALLLGIDRKTVVRKLLFLAGQAKRERMSWIEEVSQASVLTRNLQFDEMESFERSKCLPLSIPLIVHAKSRRILSLGVACMPAKGPLAPISYRKYGPRADERARVAGQLWSELKPAVHPLVQVLTDQNPRYPTWIRKHVPKARHETTPGRRGCVVGQGELKRGGYDPLFSLNHTAAMIRANVNRLFRRTWCTTKRRDRLLAHLEIYAQFHNSVLIPARA